MLDLTLSECPAVPIRNPPIDRAKVKGPDGFERVQTLARLAFPSISVQ
jgi:hypothetical protein